MASKSFCPLPWNHLATHPDGQVSLCCEAETLNGVSNAHFTVSHTRVFNTLLSTKYDFNKITNSESFNDVRLKMLNGEYPTQCKKCWDSESAGNPSKRTVESGRLNFSEEDAIKLTNIDGSLKEVNYEFIELRLGNHCNLACRTCNPISSSRWKKEWKLLDLEKSYLEVPQTNMNWPKDQNFWDKLLPHINELRYVYVNGGEPLLIDKHLGFLEALVKKDVAKNVTLVYSTNTTVSGEDYEDAWAEFKEVQLMWSIDDIQRRNEYMRYPAKWDQTLETIDWFKGLESRHDNIFCSILQTISTLNIYYLKEFHEYFKEIVPYVSPNYVTEPNYYDPAILPINIKERILEKSEGEVFYDSVKNYLTIERPDTIMNGPAENLLYRFFDITNRQDIIRKEKFKDVFPEFYDIIKEYDKK